MPVSGDTPLIIRCTRVSEPANRGKRGCLKSGEMDMKRYRVPSAHQVTWFITRRRGCFRVQRQWLKTSRVCRARSPGPDRVLLGRVFGGSLRKGFALGGNEMTGVERRAVG